MATHALGAHFCMASPHYRSTHQGLSGVINEGMTLHEGMVLINLSLFNSLPHLCGLGGDAIIMHKKNDQINVINGTGKTGSYQNTESYLTKGMNQVPRRGIYSAMIYGAPSAYERFNSDTNVDFAKVAHTAIHHDLMMGVTPSDELSKIYEKSLKERNDHTALYEWDTVLRHFGMLNQSLIKTIQRLSSAGFSDMYTGLLGSQVFRQINAIDSELYAECDFTRFTPNDSVLRETTFQDSKIFCHGNNSPWIELFLLLKIYELGTRSPEYYLHKSELARIVPYVEREAINEYPACIYSCLALEKTAKEIISRCKQTSLPEIDIINKQGHTVFLAGVNGDGELVGIINSIYTPLGAMVEIDGTGILLSNRCFSFNQYAENKLFTSNSLAKHTNNIVIVENDKYSFIIGTSGGPVQSQTLAFLIKMIVSDGYTTQQAIVLPRFANLGKHAKTGKIVYLAEPGIKDPFFTITENISNKFGVVQLAGIEKKSGRLFSCADPRGLGVALGM